MKDSSWPALSFETRSWALDPDEREFIPKSRRRKITSTYQAAVPSNISRRTPTISNRLLQRIGSITTELVRFDSTQKTKGYRLPALVLRSESAASSQIENLTSSIRNVALAEIVDNAPQNAQIISGNVAAMREALSLPDELSIENILAIHRKLIEQPGESFGGEIRKEQVWIGGTPYSPHGALFVPPAPDRVMPLLEDLVAFATRDDIVPIAQAAIAHAQFETIHPFIDGNGRTGRVLLHKQLAASGTLSYSTLPISSGLLHDMDAYMAALKAYQRGEIEPIIETLCNVLEIALELGVKTSRQIEGLLDSWNSSFVERSGSTIYRLPALLVEQPVVNASYVAEHLQITERAARDLLARAVEYEIVDVSNNKKRGRFYQATALIDILEQMTSVPEIRRTLASR